MPHAKSALALAISLLSACAPAAPAGLADLAGSGSPQTFLVLVAHPDDESLAAPALSRLQQLGHRVRLVIATDGKYGTRIADIPPDTLGPLRRRESECATTALGLPAPVFLGIDRLDTLNGVRAYLNGRKRLLAALTSELETTNPDAILTFGPDGEYGHPEHIIIGAAITEVLLRDGLTDTYPLYYFLWKKEQVADDDELSYVDARYITHKLTHTDDDEQRLFAAARCYTSQMAPEEIDVLLQTRERALTPTGPTVKVVTGAGAGLRSLPGRLPPRWARPSPWGSRGWRCSARA